MLKKHEWLLLIALLIWQTEVHRNKLKQHSADHFTLEKKKKFSPIITCFSISIKTLSYFKQLNEACLQSYASCSFSSDPSARLFIVTGYNGINLKLKSHFPAGNGIRVAWLSDGSQHRFRLSFECQEPYLTGRKIHLLFLNLPRVIV